MKKSILRERVKSDLFNNSEEMSITQREKLAAWCFALGLNAGQGLFPSEDMLSLIEKEIRGEITTEDIKMYLDEKYRKD